MSLSGCYLTINSNIIPYLLIVFFKKLLIKYQLHRKKTYYRSVEATRRFICGGGVSTDHVTSRESGTWGSQANRCLRGFDFRLENLATVMSSRAFICGFWNPGRFQNKMKRSRITWLLESRRIFFWFSWLSEGTCAVRLRVRALLVPQRVCLACFPGLVKTLLEIKYFFTSTVSCLHLPVQFWATVTKSAWKVTKVENILYTKVNILYK